MKNIIQVLTGAVCFVMAALFLEAGFGTCFLILLAWYALVELVAFLISSFKDKKNDPVKYCAYYREYGCAYVDGPACNEQCASHPLNDGPEPDRSKCRTCHL